MGLIYQESVGGIADDFNTTGVKLRVPTCESAQIVEYGFTSIATDPGAVGVLALQYIDAAGNVVTLNSFTCPAAATVSDLVAQRVDVLLDKSGDKTIVSISGTPGPMVSEADGIVAFQLNVTTAFGAGVTACPYVKWALAGTPKTATGTVLVTDV